MRWRGREKHEPPRRLPSLRLSISTKSARLTQKMYKTSLLIVAVLCLFIALSRAHLGHDHDEDNFPRVILVPRVKNVYIPDATEFHEYTPDVIVNNVTLECRHYWIRKSMEIQFNASSPANYMCPLSFFGALAVEHGNTDPTNYHDSQGNNCGKLVAKSPGSRGSVDDPSNHAETNVTRVLGTQNPGNGRNRSFWATKTMYTTGESCPNCAGNQVFAGYGEIVWSVSISTFIALGDGQVKIPSRVIYHEQVGFNPVNPMIALGHVLEDELTPYFEWRLKSFQRPQPYFECPSPCTRQLDSSGFYTCRMASLTNFTCPTPFRLVEVDGVNRCLL